MEYVASIQVYFGRGGVNEVEETISIDDDYIADYVLENDIFSASQDADMFKLLLCRMDDDTIAQMVAEHLGISLEE